MLERMYLRRDLIVKKILLVSGVIALVMFCLPAPSRLRAEQIKHHELMVDADSPAKGCLACHDGATAKYVSTCKVRCDLTEGHSLLRRYPPKGKKDQFLPVSAIKAKGIKLEKRRVTCISCHDLRNPAPRHLVMSNNNSKLCLSCHVRM